jgi:hypothetical protein
MKETSNISVIYGQANMSFDYHPPLTRTKYSTCTWSPVVGNHQKCAFKFHILAEGGLLISFFRSLYPLPMCHISSISGAHEFPHQLRE